MISTSYRIKHIMSGEYFTRPLGTNYGPEVPRDYETLESAVRGLRHLVSARSFCKPTDYRVVEVSITEVKLFIIDEKGKVTNETELS